MPAGIANPGRGRPIAQRHGDRFGESSEVPLFTASVTTDAGITEVQMRRALRRAALAAILLVSAARQVNAAPLDIQEAGDFVQFASVGTLDVGTNRIRGGVTGYESPDSFSVDLPTGLRVTAWSLTAVVGTMDWPYFLGSAELASDVAFVGGLATGSYGGSVDFTQSGPLDIRLTSNLYANHTVQLCEERGEYQYCYNVYPGAQSAPMTYDLTLTVEAVPVVPEPASLSLLGVAALVLGRRIRRRMV